MNPLRDDDGKFVFGGDWVHFSFGIPAIPVKALVVTIEEELWILTPRHNPPRLRLKELRECVGSYYRLNQ